MIHVAMCEKVGQTIQRGCAGEQQKRNLEYQLIRYVPTHYELYQETGNSLKTYCNKMKNSYKCHQNI